ncbi:P-loop NTPase [Brachybacterium rhamnosum]|uniref:CpaE family protein n=1 Tax=Brachybacterium rhamnosum TaxID=173361 RepID=A0ABW4Q1N9_9MICO
MIDLVLCASGADEVRIVHDLAQDGDHDVRVVRRCADLAETAAVVGAGIGQAVLLDLSVRGLGRDVLAGLLEHVAVIGLRAETAPEQTSLGLRQVVDAGAPIDEILAAISAAIDGEETAEPWTRDPVLDDAPEGGRVVVVWGPAGAPGRSTLAVNLAAEAARAGRDTVLVDADTYGPALGQLLGVIDEAPGIVAACRAFDRDTLDSRTLDALLPVVQPRLRLLSGIGVPSRWAELGRSSLDGLWRALSRRGELVIVDVAAPLEEDEELSYDTAAPQRNGASLTAIQRADAVIATATADPVSLTRLLRENDRLRDLGVRELHVVVNRMGSPVPGDRVKELLGTRMPTTSLHLLPDDPGACRTAVWDGALLAESSPRSPLRRALRDLAASPALQGEAPSTGPAEEAAPEPARAG